MPSEKVRRLGTARPSRPPSQIDTQETTMRRLGLTALTLAALALSAIPASAQGFGRGGIGPATYLSNKGVQKEIKADDEQAKKLDALAAEIREKSTEAQSKLEGLEGDERRQKMMEINKEINGGMMTSLGTILKPEQVKRYVQVQFQASVQMRGSMAFADRKIAEGLRITDEQKAKIREINISVGDQLNEIRRGFEDDREGTLKKVADLNKETYDKVTALLTDEQKATWKEMIGEPFEFKYES